jgi:hypothetical protein
VDECSPHLCRAPISFLGRRVTHDPSSQPSVNDANTAKDHDGIESAQVARVC